MEKVAGSGPEMDGAPRLYSLDVLRGVAILGILFMNIPEMGGTWAAAHTPQPNLLGWTMADRVAWALRELFATGTARGMLQFLFGAGIVILTGRMAAGGAGWSATRRFHWRQAVLLAFGLIHVWLLLWAGDILHTYAICAMLAFPLRRLRPRWLVLIALALTAYGTFAATMGISGAIHNNRIVAEARAAQAAGRKLTPDQAKEFKSLAKWHGQLADARREVATETAQRRSGLGGEAKVMHGEWLSRYTRWRSILNMYATSLGAILIGAALFKLGILQGARNPRFYLRMAIGWYAIGLSMRAIAAWQTSRLDDSVTLLWAFDEQARLATTLGHVGLIGWLLASEAGRRAMQPLAAAGRTALSIYILQTILCLWVIYPSWGLGLFGTQGWAALMLTAAAVNAVLLVLAVWWVRRFGIAPVEWAWRSIAAGRRLPFGRRAQVGREVPLTA